MIHATDEISEGRGASHKRATSSVEAIKELLAEVGALSNQLRKGADDAEAVRQGDGAVLKVLGNDGPLTVPEIARIRATSRQNIQMLVNRLEMEGCVELVNNPAHRRSGLVRITDQGRAALAMVTAEETKSLEKLLPHLSESELTSATASLRRVRSLLAGIEVAPRPARVIKTAVKLISREVPRPSPVARPPQEPKPPKEVVEDDFPLNLL